MFTKIFSVSNWDWTTEKPPEIEVTNICLTCGPHSSMVSHNNPDLISLQAELETTKTELERAKSKIDALTKGLKQHIQKPKLV